MDNELEDNLICYTTEDLNRWIANGIVPRDIGKRELANLRKRKELHDQAEILKNSGKSQNEILAFFQEFTPKTTMDEIGREIEDIKFFLTHKEKLLQFLKKQHKFRQSSDLIDNKLGIKESGVLTSRISLSSVEDRLVFTLSLLLSRHSERYDQRSKDYYMGNDVAGYITIDSINLDSATLVVTPHELYATYYGTENYGGNQINCILDALNNVAKTKHNITINIESKDNKIQKIRTHLELFRVVILNRDLTEAESQAIDKSNRLIEGKNCLFKFQFSSLFTNNIRKLYVEFPDDLHLRISHTAGNRISESVYLMGNLLLREKHHNRYYIERDEETLVETLDLCKEWKSGRKKRVVENIEKCLKIFSELGLISSCEKTTGSKGQIKYCMHINPDFK